MPYANDHVLLRFYGYFGTAPGVDQWSAGLRLAVIGSNVALSAGVMQTLVDSCDTAAKAFHAAAGVAAGSDTKYSHTTGAVVGPDGKYKPPTQLTTFSPVASTAGTGTPTQPWSSAHVVSLRTSNPRGYSSNGRLYWPMIAPTLQSSTGRMSAASADAKVLAAKTFIQAVNAAANVALPTMKVSVLSNVGGGTAAHVTSVRCDQRMDSIERRENNQPAAWSVQTIA